MSDSALKMMIKIFDTASILDRWTVTPTIGEDCLEPVKIGAGDVGTFVHDHTRHGLPLMSPENPTFFNVHDESLVPHNLLSQRNQSRQSGIEFGRA